MEWIEATPLPPECKSCEEEDCYNCDYACKRWYLPEKDELKIRRISILKSIHRLQQQLKDINARLEVLENE